MTIRVFLILDKPLDSAVEKMFLLLGDLEIVDSQENADLIVTSNEANVAASFDEKKWYLILKNFISKIGDNKHSNVRVIEVHQFLTSAALFLTEIREIMEDRQESPNVEFIPLPEQRPDLKCILVVDDKLENRQAAVKQLSDKWNVWLASGYDEAMGILAAEPDKFEIALLDLHMPMSPRTLSEEAFHLGELVPYGLLLLLEVCCQGVKFAAVVTDLNHHSDPFSAAFDNFTGKVMNMGRAEVMLMHAPMKDGVKDWAAALDHLRYG